jgi:hypothetical protein
MTARGELEYYGNPERVTRERKKLLDQQGQKNGRENNVLAKEAP